MSEPDALRRADYAALRITEHEKLCAVRWEQANKAIDGLHKKLWWFMGLIITGQGAVIVTLVSFFK